MSFQALSEYPMPDSFPGASPNARFLAGSLPVSDTSWKSYLLKSSWSVLLHVLGLGLLLWALTRSGAMAQLAKAVNVPDITWIATPGPGGGGGGGGNKMPDPPRKAEITPPKPRAIEPPKATPEPPKPIPQANIPAVTAGGGMSGGCPPPPRGGGLRGGRAPGGGGP